MVSTHKRSTLSMLCIGFSLWVAASTTSYAGTLSGEITFLKKPPYAGVIYILGGKSTVSTKAVVDQKDKNFSQRVITASKGQAITFNNSDTVDHNIFAQDRKTSAKFDVGLMTPGNTATVETTWPENSLIRIGCKIHPKMRAYIANVPSDHFQTFQFRDTAPPYTFTINNIPNSATKVILLLPSYDRLEIELSPSLNGKYPLLKKEKNKGELSLKYSVQ